MDFLKIRRKAKERASAAGPSAREAADSPEPSAPSSRPASSRRRAASRSQAASAGPAGGPSAHDDAPVLREADVVAGRLAAELQGIAGPSAPSGNEADQRFTTWRPGAGEDTTFEVEDAEPPSAPPDRPFLRGRRAKKPEEEPSTSTERADPVPVPPPTGAQVRTGGGTGPARAPAALRPPKIPGRNPLEEFFYREDEELPGLVGLPGDAEPEESSVHGEAAIEEYLTFVLGSEEYAVAIERVREVLKAQPITEVPRAPAGILGVVTVRGEVVAVFDPRRRLALPGPTPPEGTGRIVIVDDGEGPCGLLVDAVASVVRLARGSIEPCPQGIGGASADCLAGIGRERNRLFTVLDLGAFLRRSPPAARGGRATHAGA